MPCYHNFLKQGPALMGSLSPTYKNCCDYIWPTQAIKDNVPISRSWLNLGTYAKSLLPQEVTFTSAENQKMELMGVGAWFSLTGEGLKCPVRSQIIFPQFLIHYLVGGRKLLEGTNENVYVTLLFRFWVIFVFLFLSRIFFNKHLHLYDVIGYNNTLRTTQWCSSKGCVGGSKEGESSELPDGVAA